MMQSSVGILQKKLVLGSKRDKFDKQLEFGSDRKVQGLSSSCPGILPEWVLFLWLFELVSHLMQIAPAATNCELPTTPAVRPPHEVRRRARRAEPARCAGRRGRAIRRHIRKRAAQEMARLFHSPLAWGCSLHYTVATRNVLTNGSNAIAGVAQG